MFLRLTKESCLFRNYSTCPRRRNLLSGTNLTCAGERLQTVVRVGDTLNLFLRAPTWRLSEIAKELNMSPAMAHRLVMTMIDIGLLERDSNTLKVRLGTATFLLASSVEPIGRLKSQVHPSMIELVEQTNETVLLYVRHGEKALCVDRVEAMISLRVSMDVGLQAPLHLGASGRAILAFSPDRVIDAVLRSLEANAAPVKCGQQMSAEQCRDRLALIRSRGYETSDSEMDAGAFGIAVPVEVPGFESQACLCLAMPSSRADAAVRAQYIDLMLSIARKVGHGNQTNLAGQ